MKKFIFSSLLLSTLFSLSSLIFAQEITPTETTDIREIKVRYCNDPDNTDAKSLFIDAKIDEKSVICIDFINTSNKAANLGINFVDGTVTNDSSQNKACLPEGEKTNFGQYVSNYPDSLSIAPNSVKRIFVDLLYSGGFAGTSYGCLTFHSLDSINEESSMGDAMFQVFSRVGSFIDVFVEGDFIIKLLSTPVTSELYHNISNNPNFIIYRESTDRSDIISTSFWSYRSKWNVTNTGNIAVTGHVSFDQHSRGGLIHSYSNLSDQVILPGQTRTFEKKLPRYQVLLLGGPNTIQGSITYEPIYLGSYAEQVSSESFVLQDSTNYFFFPWIIILFIVYLIERIYIRIKKKSQPDQRSDTHKKSHTTSSPKKKTPNTTSTTTRPKITTVKTKSKKSSTTTTKPRIPKPKTPPIS